MQETFVLVIDGEVIETVKDKSVLQEAKEAVAIEYGVKLEDITVHRRRRNVWDKPLTKHVNEGWS